MLRRHGKKTISEEQGGVWIFGDIPRELMKRAKIVAAIEGKTTTGGCKKRDIVRRIQQQEQMSEKEATMLME